MVIGDNRLPRQVARALIQVNVIRLCKTSLLAAVLIAGTILYGVFRLYA